MMNASIDKIYVSAEEEEMRLHPDVIDTDVIVRFEDGDAEIVNYEDYH